AALRAPVGQLLGRRARWEIRVRPARPVVLVLGAHLARRARWEMLAPLARRARRAPGARTPARPACRAPQDPQARPGPLAMLECQAAAVAQEVREPRARQVIRARSARPARLGLGG
ncbi:MAG: hypothetical protein OXF64_05120, partial [bacterium]|nr:hypothetical protein [bacterium]